MIDFEVPPWPGARDWKIYGGPDGGSSKAKKTNKFIMVSSAFKENPARLPVPQIEANVKKKQPCSL